MQNQFHQVLCGLALILTWQTCGFGQVKEKEKPYAGPDVATTRKLAAELQNLQNSVEELRGKVPSEHRWEDVALYPKAVEWILRHKEFFRPEYVRFTEEALKQGQERVNQLKQGKAPWEQSATRTVLAYLSRVDGSVQPYAISISPALRENTKSKWPVHIILHGRNERLNEVSFLHEHTGKPLGKDQTWVEVEIYGRTNNAYRWSGETDVLEVLKDLQRRYPIDHQRVVLRGFSMGGAGSWHLGLHYPSLWCSVGPGAGFVDFYEYQKAKTPLPKTQDETLRIYDTVNYALNAFDVPVCTYGGELDAQLLASQRMEAEAKKLNVTIKVLIGPGVGHKFEPNTFKDYMAFHLKNMEQGRPQGVGRRDIRFATRTLKYNRCDWAAIEEVVTPYEESRVEGSLKDNEPHIITTMNIAALRLDPLVQGEIQIDGKSVSLNPDKNVGSILVFKDNAWTVLTPQDREQFASNKERHKRHNLQGPIDDAFTESFICVRGTGKPWLPEHAAWANWTLRRFEQEFDKGFRGKVRIVNDTELTAEMQRQHHLILFGDPGSNSVLARIASELPVTWNKDSLTVNGQAYDPHSHALAMISPNPTHTGKYIVINSGHTFHAEDFKRSNAWLFPRLGDIAVLKYQPRGRDFTEEIAWSANFDAHWKLPKSSSP